jgi:hypothetical protein
MQAAFYVKQGPAREVLQVGEQQTAEPGPGEVRVHLKTSGVNPSDWKSRSGRTAPMSAPLIIRASIRPGPACAFRCSAARPRSCCARSRAAKST